MSLDNLPVFSVDEETAFPLLKATLPPGSAITTEPGAMVDHSGTVELKGSAKGGAKKAMSRAFLSSEGLFQTTASNPPTGRPDAFIRMAPATPGTIILMNLTEGNPEAVDSPNPVFSEIFLSDGAFLASHETVKIGVQRQSLSKGLFSSAGFFVMRATGAGTLAINCYGSYRRIDLADGEEHVVDNGHVVAWTASYTTSKASKGWFSTAKTGEGVVFRFTGPGCVYITSRNIGELALSLIPFLPTPSNN